MRVEIPGREVLDIEYLVLDYNGTIAVDGLLSATVAEQLECLSRLVEVHVLTADTFGTVREQCAGLDVKVDVFPSDDAARSKAEVVASLQGGVCCMGNGHNDRLMFEGADLAIAIVGREGASVDALLCADIAVTSPEDALGLLVHPQRLIATLRG